MVKSSPISAKGNLSRGAKLRGLIDTVLFDWDGTLIDTASYAFAAFQNAFRDMGMPLETEAYEKIYSPNWYSMYRALQLPADRWQEADDLWLQYYADMRAPLIPDGLHVLQELYGRRYCLGIVTSGSRIRVMRELDGFGLSNFFRIVICNEDVRRKKPHPEGLIMALKHLKKEPHRCCYVGDTPEDIEMGRRAKVQTIGVLSGYPNSKMIAAANPDFRLDSILQLLTHLHL